MGRRRIFWFMAGFLAAGLVGSILGPEPARAQTLPTQRTYSSGSSQPSPILRPSQDETDDSYAAPGIPMAIPADDPTAVQEEDDGLNPSPRDGQRAVLQDGDPNAVVGADQPQLRDGIVDVEEPQPPQDGTDPQTVDTRDPEEIAVFENPPAGYDPQLFQIEDIDPVKDNRAIKRIGTLDPYEPVGIKIGTFVFFPETEISGSYYSNVFRSTKPLGDIAGNVVSSGRLVSNWDRHALELRYNGDLSFFSEYNTENDKAYQLEARGRLDISRHTNVQAILSHDQNQESRSALDASSVGPRTSATTDRAEGAFNHRFNRLSVQFRGSVTDYSYGNASFNGTPIINSDRNYTQTEEITRASWEFKPTLTAFTEVAINQRDYAKVAPTDGIGRSSDGERYRFGISFGTTGKILRGEASLGYGVQRPDDSRLHPVDGLILDGNATWRVTERTSLLFNARTDVSETITENVGGAFYRYLSVEARHAFLTYLVGSAGLSYATQNSQDGLIDEREIRATLGLEYYLNRETVLFGKYAHTDLNAVSKESDYASDEVHFGMKLRQ